MLMHAGSSYPVVTSLPELDGRFRGWNDEGMMRGYYVVCQIYALEEPQPILRLFAHHLRIPQRGPDQVHLHVL